MPLVLWLALAAMPASAQSSGELRFASGEPVPVTPSLEARVLEQTVDGRKRSLVDVVAVAGELEVTLRSEDSGPFKVKSAVWRPTSAAAEPVEGDVVQEGDRLRVTLKKLVFPQSAQAPVAGSLTLSPQDALKQEQRRRADVKSMPTEKKVGMLLMRALGPADLAAPKAGEPVDPDRVDYRREIAEGRLLGALSKWNTLDAASAREFRAEILRLNPHAYVAIDHEGGAKFSQNDQVTETPGNMALGAIADEARALELTERMARYMARQLCGQADMGFNLVADANTNAQNPIIANRSFGQDPEKVSALVRAALKGYNASCVALVVKHFPGHGDTDVDSHLGLPIVRKSLAELEKEEFAAFRAAIRSGAPSMMTAHIVFPAIDPELPATMSAKLIKFIHGEIGFEGVLVSDAMDMKAIADKYGPVEASVLAIAAGIDVLLMGKQDHRSIHAGLLQALKDGRLSMDRLEEAVLRILRMKDRNAAMPQDIPAAAELAESVALAKEIAEESVTLVRDPGGLVPLRLASGKKLALIVADPGTYKAQVAELVAQVRARHPALLAETVGFRPTDAEAKLALEAAARADVVVIGTHHWGKAAVAQQQALVRRLVDLGKPVVALSLMSPYDAQYIPGTVPVLAIYGMTTPGVRAAVRVLFGEIPAKGRLPVTIPGGPSAG